MASFPVFEVQVFVEVNQVLVVGVVDFQVHYMVEDVHGIVGGHFDVEGVIIAAPGRSISADFHSLDFVGALCKQ